MTETSMSSPREPVIDDWLLEKSGNVLERLAELVDYILDQQKHMPDATHEFILSKLSATLHDATKIMAYAGYGNWQFTDREVITKNGYGGYKAVSAKYRGSDTLYITDWESLWERLEPLLQGQRSRGTEIHEILRSCIARDPRVSSIKDLTESLTMGDTNWADYVGEVWSLHELSLYSNSARKR
jgi:hypothetical protein